MMWYWGSGMHWWGWLLGFLGMIVFWGFILWAVWYFVTGLIHQSSYRPRPGEAKHILDERLARGEIDATEYRYLRTLISGDDVGIGENGYLQVDAKEQQ